MASIGPTARELLDVLQPQLDNLNGIVATIQADTTYLRECAVRNATQIGEHDRRLAALEARKANGGSGGPAAAITSAHESSRALLVLVLTWLFRFGILFSVIYGLVNIDKVATILKGG